MFGRRTKTLLPTAGTLLQPKIVEGTEEKLKERKANQERYYNKGSRELPELLPGDTVRMKPLPTDCAKQWKKAMVVKQVAPRSYELDLQGSVYRRNRRHLVKTKESPPLEVETQISSPSKEIQSTVSDKGHVRSHPVEQAIVSPTVSSEVTPTSSVLCTRSGRTVRPPQRFRDRV